MEADGWTALFSLLGAVLGSILAPVYERWSSRRQDRLVASRSIRDDFYACQKLLGQVARDNRWWKDEEYNPAQRLASDDHFRLLAGHVDGETWQAVSGARRRWERLLIVRSAGADPEARDVADELHDLNKVFDEARRGLSKKDAGFEFTEHDTRAITRAHSEGSGPEAQRRE